MVQGLVNSFGPTIMAAFAAAVKIDTFAYLPVQDFGNAYSTFAAQNFGAENESRIREGTRKAFLISIAFSIGRCVCRNADGRFRGADGDRNHCGRRAVFAH